MKTMILAFTLTLFMSNAFAQTEKPKEIPPITVPNFSGVGVKSFYQSYADHLIKCVTAIRAKDEARVKALFKNPGEQLVAKEKIMTKEVIKTPAEKQKYMAFAMQVSPLVKEVQESEYFKKMYGQ